MATPLHQYVSPPDLAERRQVIEYKGSIGEFERLAEIAATDLGEEQAAPAAETWQAAPVAIRLQFAWADARREVPTVSGHVAAEMPAVCQRCLQAFRYPLENEVNAAIVAAGKDQQELADETGADIWEVEQNKLRLADLVEEALIMAMPLAPTHGEDHPCGRREENAGEAAVNNVRPFADLKANMNKLER